MSRRGGRLALVGLGALSLACATAKPPPTSMDLSAEEAVRLKSSAQELSRKLSECAEKGPQVSVQEEYALGAAVAANWVKGGGGLMLSEQFDKELELYLNLVGRNLAAQSSRPTLEWTFGALKEPRVFNAASAPGGYVFVTQGLLKAVENEAQLAGVLAHEIAHVTLRHALMRYSEVKVTQCRMAVGIGVMMARMRHVTAHPQAHEVSGFAESLQRSGALDLDKHQELLVTLTDRTVEKLITEGYAQRDEYAADEEAVRLLVSAGYDPQEYIRLLGKLPDVKDSYAHHPSKETRQKNLRRLLAAELNKSEDFSDLPAGTPGLSKPPLPPAFSTLKSAQ
jgi:predicted Zn-dependent protease